MSRSLWLRFAGISVLFALILSVLYTLVVREIASGASNEVQRSVYLFVARIVEQPPYAHSLAHIESFRAESPAMPMQLWVVSGSGKVLATNTRAALPDVLQKLGKPQQVHEVLMRGRFFSGAPAVAVVRLNAAEPTYLVVRNQGNPGRHVFLLLGIAVVAAVISGTRMTISLPAMNNVSEPG